MAKPITKLALTKRAVIGGALALALSHGASAETASGEMLAHTCAGCHGTNGSSVGPASPSIASIDPYVFVDMMNAYKDDSTYSTIMGRIARGYSDEEFEAMAEYFHAQELIPAKQEFDTALVEQGAKLHDKFCEKCHIEGGQAVPEEEDYYILAGQWTPYLRFAQADFLEERRQMPKKMASKVKEMLEKHPEGAWDALWAFYASQQ